MSSVRVINIRVIWIAFQERSFSFFSLV